jgi:hypothetical protein
MRDRALGAEIMPVSFFLSLYSVRLRRLVIAEADRFPELGRALYHGGPGRAIAGLAVNLQRWADRDLLAISDAMVAATQFNWLVMGEPVNQAMFNADYVLPKDARNQHAQKQQRPIESALRNCTRSYTSPVGRQGRDRQ